ncbi:hypothetical protein D9615_009849 [Tricholomella constricta]|uniref:CFEM domain-containing protein n=1 Tax=Tricholomella constricta TaxID=117010 RepID=A0A8H5GWY8_9AGAR|nr:hypothetical protein D9615_009849 [Tricholomella constricta]
MVRLSTLLTNSLLLLLVSAQSVRDLPTCAVDCAATAAIASGCSQIDAACLCKASVIAATKQCASKTCPREDQSLTNGILGEICSNIPLPSSASPQPETPASTLPTSTQSAPLAPSQSPTSSQTISASRSQSSSAHVSTAVAATLIASSSSIENLVPTPGTTLRVPPVSPSSTVVVVSTVVPDLEPTSNAAVRAGPGPGTGTGTGVVGFGFGIGALAMGLVALL